MVIFKLRNLNTGQATPIPPGEYTVGRDDDAYIHVDDGSVSRRHAKVINLEEGFFVEDAGSSNGTAAGGVMISNRVKVEFGDMIHFGAVPFRIDPEVAGEPVTVTPTEMRKTNRIRISKATERLPAIGESGRVVPIIPPEKLAAPEVNPNDVEAETLNAITIREPEPAAPKRLPVIRPGLSSLPQGNPDQMVLPQTKSQNLGVPRPKLDKSLSRHLDVPKIATPTVASVRQNQPVAVPAHQSSLEEAPHGLKWVWLILTFLAGLGVGLLLGLIFAKLFIEMGGKPGYLP